MLDEKECPREDRLLQIHFQLPRTGLPNRTSIDKIVKGKAGISMNLNNEYLNWVQQDNQLIVYTGYGYCDFTTPKSYNYLININNPNESKLIQSKIIFAIWNGLLPLETIEHGHKTICVIEFFDGIPDELSNLKDMDEWLNSKENFQFGLCDKADSELILKKLGKGK